MKMRHPLMWIAIVGLLMVVPRVASAQTGWTGTVLLGPMLLDGPRPSIGVAFGYSPSVAGFEIEYLGTLGGESADHSSAGGVVANAIVHPLTRGPLQFFALGGFGMWGETFANGTGTGAIDLKDIGGGVKFRLSEHFRLRLDYRVFLVGDTEGASAEPSTKHPQRFSAGLHLAF